MKHLLLITTLLTSQLSFAYQQGGHDSHKAENKYESHKVTETHNTHSEHKKHLESTISVHHPIIKTTPPGITNSAAYFTLVNHGDKDITLLGVTSDGAKLVEMHEHIKHNGTFTMQKMKPLTIPANSKANFEPSGNHIMFIGVTKSIEDGDKINMTLRFDDGTQKTISAVAKNQHNNANKAQKHH